MTSRRYARLIFTSALRRRALALAALLWPAIAAGQSARTGDAVMRAVPSSPASAGVLRLSLGDAVKRGLEYNLSAVIEDQQRRVATGGRLQALSALLPHVSANVRESAQVINTAAFGFSGFGDLPNIIGPFTVFDARVSMSAALFDPAAIAQWQSKRALANAAEADYRTVRETVVLAIGNVYLEAVSDAARVASTTAQVETAEAFVRLATDQNAAGVIARVDVLRQQVQLESARAQAIAAANQLAKRKLQLARAIGVPATQSLELTETVAFTPAPAISVEAAVAEAESHREDLKAAQARVDAARAAKRAAMAAGLPSLKFDGDVGALGLTASSAARTYTLAASLHVPIFEGGRRRAQTIQADAEVRQREAELADLEGGLRFDISTALLDVNAAAAAVDVARSGESLAREELTQAQDRFRAGVASTIELSQAQDAVARASEQYIASVYSHNIAKAQFARAMGEGEARFMQFVGGQP